MSDVHRDESMLSGMCYFYYICILSYPYQDMMTVGTKSVENERAVTSQHWHRPAAGKDVRGGVKQLSSLLPIFPSCWAAWPLGGVLVLVTAGFAWTFGILLFSSP